MSRNEIINTVLINDKLRNKMQSTTSQCEKHVKDLNNRIVYKDKYNFKVDIHHLE